MIAVKRIYDEPSADDGFRVLVDRLWPRGVSRQRAALDLWLKEVAPSTELRQWFHHDDPPFTAFAERYDEELDANPGVRELQAVVAGHPLVTLLVAARDVEENHATVLREHLERLER
jgi:uncharacterized protein YeaO (DUF488 family)